MVNFTYINGKYLPFSVFFLYLHEWEFACIYSSIDYFDNEILNVSFRCKDLAIWVSHPWVQISPTCFAGQQDLCISISNPSPNGDVHAFSTLVMMMHQEVSFNSPLV